MEPQGRTIASPLQTRRQSETFRLGKTTLRVRAHVQAVGLTAKTKNLPALSRRRDFFLDIPFYRNRRYLVYQGLTNTSNILEGLLKTDEIKHIDQYHESISCRHDCYHRSLTQRRAKHAGYESHFFYRCKHHGGLTHQGVKRRVNPKARLRRTAAGPSAAPT